MDINEILSKYTAGEVDLEETNAALVEAGAGYHLEPGRNEITEADLRETVVGYYPEQASGWGLLDTGTGSLDKVHIDRGWLPDGPINEVMPDGSTNMAAYVTICGKRYEVMGDQLVEVRECEACKVPSLPQLPDMTRNTSYAGMTVEQKTKTGTYLVHYDINGYAVEAKKKEVQ